MIESLFTNIYLNISELGTAYALPIPKRGSTVVFLCPDTKDMQRARRAITRRGETSNR